MKKSILLRLFGLGAIPKQLRPTLDMEDIVIAQEGISVWFVGKNVKGPGRRYINKHRWFPGCLVVTKKRIASFAFRKKEIINISAENFKKGEIFLISLKQIFSLYPSSHLSFTTDGRAWSSLGSKRKKPGNFIMLLN